MDSQNKISPFIPERYTKEKFVCTTLGYLDGNLGIVMNKLCSLWEKHSYFGSSCAFLFTEGKEGNSLFLFVHITSAGFITNVK